jgi:hypothetical protein
MLEVRENGNICLKDKDNFLRYLRKSQRELLEEWKTMNVNIRAKWNLMAGVRI